MSMANAGQSRLRVDPLSLRSVVSDPKENHEEKNDRAYFLRASRNQDFVLPLFPRGLFSRPARRTKRKSDYP